MFDHRAKGYDNLQWVNENEYMDILIKLCEIRSDSLVCDAGTGTGKVAYELSKYGGQITAFDNCEEMLDIAIKKRSSENINYICKDISLPFPRKYDCIVSRMVFHHIKDDKAVAKNCIRSLSKWGRLVIAEGIPQEGTEDFYEEVFKIKEDRRVYTIQKLVRLFKGLKGICVNVYNQKDMSILNWLENSGLPKEKQKQIFNLHFDAAPYIQKAYNMRFVDGDIIMDWRAAIVTGRKW